MTRKPAPFERKIGRWALITFVAALAAAVGVSFEEWQYKRNQWTGAHELLVAGLGLLAFCMGGAAWRTWVGKAVVIGILAIVVATITWVYVRY